MATSKSIRFPGTRHLVGPTGTPVASGFNLSVAQANITSAGVVPVSKNTYTQANQPQADTIEVVSSDGADTTQTITHVGIDGLGNRVEETVTLTGVAAAATSAIFSYWEFSVLSAVTAGNVTIREGSADQAITTITAGDLVSQVAHIFSGENTLLITGFTLGMTTIAGNVTATLRRYAAASSCVALTGFTALDTIYIYDTEGFTAPLRSYWPMALRIGPGEYVAIAATGEGGNDEDVVVGLSGLLVEHVHTT